MVYKCVVYGCKSGYKQSQGNVPLFRFTANESGLFKKWVSFVNCTNRKPSANSVICVKHFLDIFICNGSRNIILDLKIKQKQFITI